MNKISIALGAYNGARFLPEQLESFSAQTVLPDELIVSDDCSTDATAEVIREYARAAPFPVTCTAIVKISARPRILKKRFRSAPATSFFCPTRTTFG